MTSYRVINQYGIGGDKGDVVYAPRCTGKDAHTRCEQWLKRNDTANTMTISEYDYNSTSHRFSMGGE